MNGVHPSVVAMRAGANTLCTAYASTNVLPPVTILLCARLSPSPSQRSMATTSSPLPGNGKGWSDPERSAAEGTGGEGTHCRGNGRGEDPLPGEREGRGPTAGGTGEERTHCRGTGGGGRRGEERTETVLAGWTRN